MITRQRLMQRQCSVNRVLGVWCLAGRLLCLRDTNTIHSIYHVQHALTSEYQQAAANDYESSKAQ
jgi:hypothetical protein